MNEAYVRKENLDSSLFLDFINWRNKSFVLKVAPRCPLAKNSYSICKCMCMLFILVSEIFPNYISLAVNKCKRIKISSVSEKKGLVRFLLTGTCFKMTKIWSRKNVTWLFQFEENHSDVNLKQQMCYYFVCFAS